ncbi:OLC1v1001222C1 [Oldenlandia corymbosa var. corymbosa]|uniref:OLC1v1001222C1 n=1 Tax=Oldenlandia corymbosa var. corymbosa TaxID=529605 RepID=A0AAV1D8A6_OLDCO|nr:OLC1v1001222C1 [Oldenlandia corymbosa var. corymbosa]
MDEKSHGVKEPLSLNQRHNRLLSDYSISRSKPLTKISADEQPSGVKTNVPGRRRLRKAFAQAEDDDVPDFSGIVDFDSPSPPPRPCSSSGKTETKHSPKVSEIVKTTEAPASFVMADFDSPSPSSGESKETNFDLDGSQVYEKNVLAGETGCHLNGAAGSLPNLPGAEDNPEKVRIEGRRRLCKVTKGVGNASTVKAQTMAGQKAEDLMISNFDLVPQLKADSENDANDGVNEIRDILDDLNSKFEILSIERKPVPKRMDFTKEPGNVDKNDINLVQKKGEYLEFGSAASSFSSSSGSSLDSAKESNAQCANRKEPPKIYDLDDEMESHSSLGKVNKSTNTYEISKENDIKLIGGKSVSTKQSVYTTLTGKEKVVIKDDCVYENDDDCVFVSGKNFENKAEKGHRKIKRIVKNADKYNFLMEASTDDYSSDEEHTITLSGPRFSFELPGKVAKSLYPHQRDGLKWLWSLHCKGEGGILGDDMGLGKTMQISSFLAGLFHSRLIKRALIVAPKTLLPQWIKELTTVGLAQMIREYYGTNVNTRQYELQYVLQDKGILLTTYDIVRHNAKSLSGEFYDGDEDEVTWDYLILDEGHLIKNPSTQRAKSLIQIPAARRIIISGTPLQNNLKELWALFYFCCPELLGEYKWFRDKYEKLINRGNEKNASDREKRIGSTVAKDLREKIQPYFLRRLKSDVFREDNGNSKAQLSKKNELIVWLKLTRCQQQIYEAFLKSEIVLSAFDGSPLAALTILKKICDHPLLLTKRAAEDVLEGMDSMLNPQDHGVAERLAMHIADFTEMFDVADAYDISCKTSFILSILGELIPKKHHVLIFSQTRKMLNIIQESLISNGYEFMRIDGTTKACDRLQIVNDFQEGRGAPIFLLTSQVGGLGLTLTKADRVIVVDPAWNPSTDNQSVDRAYRIGQTKDVIVYRLMTCGTVEEKIYRMQIFKGGLFKSATEHKEQMRYFSKQDLQELFSLPKQGFEISLTQQQLVEEHCQEQMMDDSIKADVEFLESLDIAGVSQHSLLFSKVAPEPVVVDEEEMSRLRGNMLNTRATTHFSSDQVNHGEQYAFNPKDVKLQQKNSSPSPKELTENEIRENINRLSQILANKATISKLPDKGEKIQKRIAALSVELRNRMENRSKNEKAIYVEDDLFGDFERLNMK